MQDDNLNVPPVSLATKVAGAREPPNRDLRLEILELRDQLKRRENAAERHLMMLREGDHRIKNSLQLVASLMTLQSRRETSIAARSALRAAAARVSGVAAIHDALQVSSGVDMVDLGAALHKMCASLHAMAGDLDHIAVIVDAESIDIPVKLAQPLVLAVNELVVNALRHAFVDRLQGSVRVILSHPEGGIVVVVADDGVGLPPDHGSSNGYGLSLVHMMVKQIGATLVSENSDGARFTIHAPFAHAA